MPTCTYTGYMHYNGLSKFYTVNPGHSKKKKNFVFKTDIRLMQVKSIAECHSLSPLVCLFLSGSLGQLLLYYNGLSKFYIIKTRSLVNMEIDDDFIIYDWILLFACWVFFHDFFFGCLLIFFQN